MLKDIQLSDSDGVLLVKAARKAVTEFLSNGNRIKLESDLEKKFVVNMIEIAPKFVVDKRCGKILEKCVLESEMPATYYTLDEIASKMQKSPLKMKNAIKKLQDAGFMASPTSLNPTGFRTDCRIDEILKLLS